MSVEPLCCVVTVSESSSSRDRRSASCSGVVLNVETGFVVCSGTVFSHFLTDKECINKARRSLPESSFSREMEVSVHYEGADNVRANGSPICHQNAKLLLMFNCVEFEEAFQKMFRESENWSFYGGEEEAVDLFKSTIISWYALLKVPSMATSSTRNTLPWVKSTALKKGQSVLACGSPFGSFHLDLFMSTLSKGIVSNVAGQENALILTDARCLPGTEGGGLFLRDGDENSPCLVGLVASPLCWKSDEWVALTLVCSFHLILQNLQQAIARSLKGILIPDAPQVEMNAGSNPAHEKYPVVVVVESGQLWGSGILLNPNLVLTCRHVVDGKRFLTVRIRDSQKFHTVRGQVVFSTTASSPYDVAVVQLQEPYSDTVSPQFASSFQPGEDVVVLGYGAFGKNCGPSVTSGILSRVIIRQNRPVMLQTTCAVQFGASGAAVLRARTGELLGVISSNTRDCAAKVTYPHLNFSIPVTVLEPLLSRFVQTGDAAVFQALDSAEEEVRRVWRLQIPQSKL